MARRTLKVPGTHQDRLFTIIERQPRRHRGVALCLVAVACAGGCKSDKKDNRGGSEVAVPVVVALASIPSGQLELTSAVSAIGTFGMNQTRSPGCEAGGSGRSEGASLVTGSSLPARIQFRGFASGATATTSLRAVVQMDSPQPQAQWVWTYEVAGQQQSFAIAPPATISRLSMETASGKKVEPGALPGNAFEVDETSVTLRWSLGGTLQSTAFQVVVVDEKAVPVLTCRLPVVIKEGSQIIDLATLTPGKTYLVTVELTSITYVPMAAQSWIVKTIDWRNNNIVRKKIG